MTKKCSVCLQASNTSSTCCRERSSWFSRIIALLWMLSEIRLQITLLNKYNNYATFSNTIVTCNIFQVLKTLQQIVCLELRLMILLQTRNFHSHFRNLLKNKIWILLVWTCTKTLQSKLNKWIFPTRFTNSTLTQAQAFRDQLFHLYYKHNLLITISILLTQAYKPHRKWFLYALLLLRCLK